MTITRIPIGRLMPQEIGIRFPVDTKQTLPHSLESWSCPTTTTFLDRFLILEAQKEMPVFTLDVSLAGDILALTNFIGIGAHRDQQIPTTPGVLFSKA